LLKEPSGASRVYEVDEELLPSDGAGSRRLSGAVRLLWTGKGIWVSAALETDDWVECSRCLEEFSEAIQFTIEEDTFPLGEPEGGRLEILDNTGEGLRIDENHILDLTDAVSQYAALSVPMNPICRPDCKGICPVCGADLNESNCQCDIVVRDIRWGELLDMLAPTESIEEHNN
jgi:uncharacterized protein